jgi:hypothetical protein
MAKKILTDKEKIVLQNETEQIEVVKENTMIVSENISNLEIKEKETLKLFKELENLDNFKNYINEFFKFYIGLGFKETNTLLNSSNCIENLTDELDEILHLYLLGFKKIYKPSNSVDSLTKIRRLTNSFRELYPFHLHIVKNRTLIFKNDIKHFYIGEGNKLYSIEKKDN